MWRRVELRKLLLAVKARNNKRFRITDDGSKGNVEGNLCSRYLKSNLRRRLYYLLAARVRSGHSHLAALSRHFLTALALFRREGGIRQQAGRRRTGQPDQQKQDAAEFGNVFHGTTTSLKRLCRNRCKNVVFDSLSIPTSRCTFESLKDDVSELV